MKYITNKYVRFAIIGLLYLLWVIWVQNFWLLFGLVIVFDMYVTEKVNWTFWKKRTGKNNKIVEWLDALIFAVIAVTLINTFLFQNYKIPTGSMEKSLLIGDHLFVSKVSYGPRIPNTPLSFPFTQHSMPGSSAKSFSTLIQWPYKRIKGFSSVKRDVPVVFNFPAGDTVIIQNQAASYYSIIRDFVEREKESAKRGGKPLMSDSEYYSHVRNQLWTQTDIVVRPVDKRDNYIKRCVGIPGDVLQIKDTKLYVNGKPQADIDGIQFNYTITTNGTPINPKVFDLMEVNMAHRRPSGNIYSMPLSDKKAAILKKSTNVVSIVKNVLPKGEYDYRIFPHNKNYQWNEDNFGPLTVPAEGVTVNLTTDNISMYERIIGAYEGNKLVIKDSTIFINDEVSTSYTFKMDYYWMMGDNRHHSADSRYWGFVPIDHIVGRPRVVWLSLNKDKSFPASIRWKRFFKGVK